MLSTARFSDRVREYIKSRPGYPDEAIDFIVETLSLSDDSVVADIGSGTGISAKPFLHRGMTVFGVEPNKEMRVAGEEFLAEYPKFISNHGTAESTGLLDHSIDLLLAAQAFHWFNREAAKNEAHRILKSAAHSALLWNERLVDTTPFLREYESLIREFSTDYAAVDHRNIDDAMLEQFFEGPFLFEEFPNVQRFDYEGLEGRLLSSSYMPRSEHSNYPAMIERLRDLFEKRADSGIIEIVYACKVFIGEV